MSGRPPHENDSLANKDPDTCVFKLQTACDTTKLIEKSKTIQKWYPKLLVGGLNPSEKYESQLG